MILCVFDGSRLPRSRAIHIDVYKWPVGKCQMNFLSIWTYFIYSVKNSDTHLFYHFGRIILSLGMHFYWPMRGGLFSISEWWILLSLPCGDYKGSALVFVIILYLDYSRALILLANFKAHVLLGLSLPFTAISPAAAGVVPRLRGSTWTTRIFNFWMRSLRFPCSVWIDDAFVINMWSFLAQSENSELAWHGLNSTSVSHWVLILAGVFPRGPVRRRGAFLEDVCMAMRFYDPSIVPSIGVQLNIR